MKIIDPSFKLHCGGVLINKDTYISKMLKYIIRLKQNNDEFRFFIIAISNLNINITNFINAHIILTYKNL